MGSHLSSSPESAPAALAGLRAAGFTEPEAGAIGELVKSTTGQAVDTLRNEFVRWHAYLALYLLAQIGIVLLTVLLIQIVREPLHQASAPGNTAPSSRLRSEDCVRGLGRDLAGSTPGTASDELIVREARRDKAWKTFLVEAEVPKTLRSRRAWIYHNLSVAGSTLDSDSTL